MFACFFECRRLYKDEKKYVEALNHVNAAIELAKANGWNTSLDDARFAQFVLKLKHLIAQEQSQ